MACSLADWGSEHLPPQKSSRSLGRSVPYTFRFLTTPPTARTPVTGNADRSERTFFFFFCFFVFPELSSCVSSMEGGF